MARLSVHLHTQEVMVRALLWPQERASAGPGAGSPRTRMHARFVA